MKLLLDTHAFLWWLLDDPRLSDKARAIIADGDNDLFLSAASGWEISIKARLGRLQLPDNLTDYMIEQLQSNAITVLPIQFSHALHVHHLPDHYKDPFDRMLIAQSQLENLPLLTNDQIMTKYNIAIIW